MQRPQQRGKYIPRPKEPEHKINHKILHSEVRITGVHPETGEKLESRVLPIAEALQIAQDLGVDLVEISSDVDPPICRVIEYSKFLYQNKQKEKEKKKNSQDVETKELRLTPTTDTHDLEFKTKHAQNWLANGCRVKCVVVFSGREMMFKDKGEMLLLKLSQMVGDVGKVEYLPKMEGKRMYMIMVPRKK